jgi:hypothetical protein
MQKLFQKRRSLYLIRKAATRWKLPRIWLDAYREGGVADDISLVGARPLAEDLECFGFETIGDLYVDIPDG